MQTGDQPQEQRPGDEDEETQESKTPRPAQHNQFATFVRRTEEPDDPTRDDPKVGPPPS